MSTTTAVALLSAGGGFLALLAAALMASARARRIRSHPAVSEARRYALFAMDRPMRAEACIDCPTRKARREAMSDDYPRCGEPSLARAVWEAEYNEFAVYELEQEARAVKKASIPEPVKRLALSELRWAAKRMPRGVTAVFRVPKGRPKELLYRLPDAHEWLRQVRGKSEGPSPAEAYAAVRSSRFRCTACARDWNDGARLAAVRTASGAMTVLCERCRGKAAKET